MAAPQAAARPPRAFPRRIDHEEKIEYRFDPETGKYDAKMVEASEPVVTEWDMSPPEREERPVGTWDVTPGADGVAFTNGERVSIPEGVKAQLRKEAEETGEMASTTTTLRYNHDLDSRETDESVSKPSRINTPEMRNALRRAKDRPQGGELDGRYQELARLLRAQQQPKAGKHRSASRRKEKQGGYKLPQIVVIQEPTSTRRLGGL